MARRTLVNLRTLTFCIGLAALTRGAPAEATQLQVTSVTCPLGEGNVKVYTKVAANTHGGFDSDLAAYSVEGQHRTWAVSTCPSTLFSLLGVDMARPLDAAAQPRLRAALADELSRLPDKANPAVWDRYGIAARMYRELGRDKLFIAELLLEASWTGRDEAVGVYEGLEGPAATRALLDQGALELKKSLPPAQRKILLYNLARVAARGGYPTERDSYLRAFEAASPLTEKEAAAVARFRVGVAAELRYQDRAIEAFKEGLRLPDLPMDKKIRSTYILADLLRRRGQPREALGLYTLVIAQPDAPEPLREMALTLAVELEKATGAAAKPSGGPSAPQKVGKHD